MTTCGPSVAVGVMLGATLLLGVNDVFLHGRRANLLISFAVKLRRDRLQIIRQLVLFYSCLKLIYYLLFSVGRK
jgi:hypothetical protein